MEDTDMPESAIEAAEELRSDLEAIADSDLPFARDAEAILNEMNETMERSDG